MESYSLTVTEKNVKIARDKEYWRLGGISDISIQSIEQYLLSIDLMKQSKDGLWCYDNCIEFYIINKEGLFQGIEMKGCLIYFDEGIELCYNFINEFSENIVGTNIYVLSDLIDYNNFKDFYSKVKIKYQEKIDFFRKQNGDISFKATCSEYYKKINKRSKWYYKLFRNLK